MNTVNKWRPCFRFGVIGLERWLSKNALSGLRLQSVNGWKFTFISSAPKERRYFCYSNFGNEKGITYDYLRAKELYSLRSSDLNKSELGIFEVDLQKIDEKFNWYVKLRNRYYLNHYRKLTCFWLVMLMLYAVACLIERSVAPYIFAVPAVFLLYSLMSLFTMKFYIGRRK